MKAGWKPSGRRMKGKWVQRYNPVIRRKGSSLRLLGGQSLGGDLLQKHPAFVCFSSNALSRQWSYNTVQITSDIFGSGSLLTFPPETVSTTLWSHSAALSSWILSSWIRVHTAYSLLSDSPHALPPQENSETGMPNLPQGDKTLQLLPGTPQQQV